MLKSGISCAADTTLITMRWDSDEVLPVGNFTTPHKCINWDHLMKWVEPKSFDAYADGVLTNPDLGM